MTEMSPEKETIRNLGCEPNFLNYQGYPASVCVSVNDEVVHGIPRKDHIIKEGDIVSLDTGLIYKGYHSDAARTHGVGEISKEAALLIERTRESFFQGMQYARAGRRLYEISGAIGDYAESYGYGVVYDLVGHGIGTHLHEEPEIPNFRQWRRGLQLARRCGQQSEILFPRRKGRYENALSYGYGGVSIGAR